MTIIDKHIEDFEQTLEELKKDDGHVVAVKVRSRNWLGPLRRPECPAIRRYSLE